ncbi:MAG: DivIVA domain-containing protein, partial [Acidimicrobiia bacterium]|nr:DivIVA domain-containing protein [Acidimicrobiia bacterium]
MEMSPQQVRSIAFSTVKKGYDSGEVNAFVQEVATA